MFIVMLKWVKEEKIKGNSLKKLLEAINKNSLVIIMYLLIWILFKLFFMSEIKLIKIVFIKNSIREFKMFFLIKIKNNNIIEIQFIENNVEVLGSKIINKLFII